jgi:ABC-type transport system involved in cytochrome bd biosynthesis fused ATPase/permease subunit
VLKSLSLRSAQELKAYTESLNIWYSLALVRTECFFLACQLFLERRPVLQEIEAASSAAMLHESILTRFPEQYDTVVGERGLRLSGGEKQRVAFARALLKNPAVLILDEATSSLDSITEHEIQLCLKRLKAERTTVTVAHRLSTIMEADMIVALDNGQIVEAGTHGELISRGGLYARLWQRQQASLSANDDLVSRGAPVPANISSTPHKLSPG